MYAYGRAGGRLTSDQDKAFSDLEIHRTRRDQLRAWLTQDGQAPLPPAPAYQVPSDLRSDASARDLLATVELRLIPLYTQLVGESMGDTERRVWAIRCVRDCAVAAQRWGAANQAFPWPQGEPPPV
jgi:hypothetical protein